MMCLGCLSPAACNSVTCCKDFWSSSQAKRVMLCALQDPKEYVCSPSVSQSDMTADDISPSATARSTVAMPASTSAARSKHDFTPPVGERLMDKTTCPASTDLSIRSDYAHPRHPADCIPFLSDVLEEPQELHRNSGSDAGRVMQATAQSMEFPSTDQPPLKFRSMSSDSPIQFRGSTATGLALLEYCMCSKYSVCVVVHIYWECVMCCFSHSLSSSQGRVLNQSSTCCTGLFR